MTLGPEYLDSLREGLEMLGSRVGDFVSPYDGNPEAGSSAETEQKTAKRPESIVSAWALGSILLEHGADHVSVFRKTLTEPVEVIACFTCVRSMLESCALATWLLDSSIDSEKRISRVYAHRYAGREQQLKFMRAIGTPQPELDAEVARIDALEAEATALGYDRVLDKKGKRVGICERTPSATDIIESELEEGLMYRMLSAIAHGHSWAIIPLGFRQQGDATVGGTKVKQFDKSTDLRGIALLGTCALNAFSRPIWNQCQYFGWDSIALKEILEEVADKLDLADAKRFWRS